jgi:hypothetical protein
MFRGDPLRKPESRARYLDPYLSKTQVRAKGLAQVFPGRAASLSLRYCGSRSLRIVVIGLATKIEE